ERCRFPAGTESRLAHGGRDSGRQEHWASARSRTVASSSRAPTMRSNKPGARGVYAAVHESAFDAVDGSCTGTEVPWMWVLLRPPRFGGAKHASGHDNWSRYR